MSALTKGRGSEREFITISGHPQVIKVVQSTANKALGGIVSTTNAGGLKVFKTPSQESQVQWSNFPRPLFPYCPEHV